MESLSNKTLEKLKYDLVRDNIVSYETIEKAQELASAQNINLGQVLINLGVLKEEQLLKFLESKLHIPYVNLDDYSIDTRCLDLISFNDAKKYKIIPLFKIEDVLTIAMADPLDLFAIEKILEKVELEVEPVISSENAVMKKIEEYYKTDHTVGQIFIDDSQPKFDWRDEIHNENLSEEHIQKIIRSILKQAILENVHELFFEHGINGLAVNFKQNGEVLQKGFVPDLLVSPFIMRLKFLSNLDPQVSEIPQLGKLSFKVDELSLVASVSAFPIIQGERIAIKIYKPPKNLIDLQLDTQKRALLKDAFSTPGIVLVGGSNLSGKTHFIYSLLSEIGDSSKNVMTIESITKYDLPNVNQCELNENIGFNLDKAMRFIEFQSPDVIYFEGIATKEGLDYFSSLVFKDKVLITEFLANNFDDLRKKLSYPEFGMFKSLLSCLVFMHSQNSIEVFDKEALEKYL
ncbi:Flp pilus assembly complex ATPase component TadA [bacterium]|nr:Flp pilus assembly complex ATPase component TadA [bacterium]